MLAVGNEVTLKTVQISLGFGPNFIALGAKPLKHTYERDLLDQHSVLFSF